MKNKLLFGASLLGLAAGCVAAYFFAIKRPALAPVFDPAADPYADGIYAEGIVESPQPSGENVTMFPEVSGTVARIPVAEGDRVKKGRVLLLLDDSIPKAAVEVASAALKMAQDTADKLVATDRLSPGAVSRDQLDTAVNAAAQAKANLDAQLALYGKYALRAPFDAIVMSVNASPGDFVSAQGTYGTYIEAAQPVLTLAAAAGSLNVRCFVDEILVSRLPPLDRLDAKMFVRGSKTSLALRFLRVQPFVSPKIELADEREERVDVRVLPLLFRIVPAAGVTLYPGELVDIYIGKSEAPPLK